MKFILSKLIVISFCLFCSVANANEYKELFDIDYIFLMDQDTGRILLEKNANQRVAPSSMTKLMTAYVVFNEIQLGNIRLNNQCLIGKDAWRKGGSTMFLNNRDIVSVDELIRGLIVVSGNDSAVALAQSVSGSVSSFARLMNKTAKRIGLKDSNFKNPHGLNQDNHYMTLRDLGILTQRIAKDFPQYMHYFSIKNFTYGGIAQYNRNPLIRYKYEGATGMKTGYTSDGGYGVVGSATQGNQRLIAVTNNMPTHQKRTKVIMQVLDYGFDNFKNVLVFSKNEVIAKADLWLGEEEKLNMVPQKDILITLKNNQTIEDIDFEVKYKKPIFTPVKKGDKVGSLVIKKYGLDIEIPLYANNNIKKASYFNRMWRVLQYKLANFRQ